MKALEGQCSFRCVQVTGAEESDPHGTLTPQRGQRLLPDSTRAATTVTCPGDEGITAMLWRGWQRVTQCQR